MRIFKRCSKKVSVVLSLFAISLGTHLYAAQYDVGASDSEIKIGNTAPLTGPLAATNEMFSTAALAYIDKINKEEGGVNNRKIVILRKDDQYDPSKTVEVTRELVEKDRVLFIYYPLGTPTSIAVKDYLNQRRIPQLFVIGASEQFYDPVRAPWTLSIYPKYTLQADILAKYLLKHKPNARVGVLYLNSDFGHTFYNGFKDGLGDKASSMIAKAVPINTTDSSVDFQIQALKNSGADTLLLLVVGRLTVPSLKLAYDSGWKPSVLLFGNLATGNIMQEVGLEKLQGAIAAQVFKSPEDPSWKDDKSISEYKKFMHAYYPTGDVNNGICVQGYFAGQLLVAILKKAGDNLTRENIMNIAKNMNYTSADFPVLLPGIELHTSPTNYEMFSTMNVLQFDGTSWKAVE
jgi:branched-chain amino acid transport system substrate-binding protein